MMYVYERMTEQLVRDRHDWLAEMYDSSQRPGAMATGIGSLLIRAGKWLRHDVEMPGMPVVTTPGLRPGGCDG